MSLEIIVDTGILDLLPPLRVLVLDALVGLGLLLLGPRLTRGQSLPTRMLYLKVDSLAPAFPSRDVLGGACGTFCWRPPRASGGPGPAESPVDVSYNIDQRIEGPTEHLRMWPMRR